MTAPLPDAPPPPWLDDAEQEAWRALVAVVLRLPAALDRQLRQDHGLTHVEYWVLALLSESPGRQLPLTDLAAEANASLSRLSHVISRLEEHGLVARDRSSTDGRVRIAVLTDAGLHAVVAAAPSHVAEVRRLVFDPLDPDHLPVLTAAMRGMARAIDVDRATAARHEGTPGTGATAAPPMGATS